MGITQRWTNSNRDSTINESNYRLLLLCLGLLNGALLIVAVAIGIKCATVKQGSDQVSHTAASELISKLKYLRSSHSDMIEAEEEAKKQLEKVLSDHANLKMQLEHQKEINDGCQKGIEDLHTEQALLQSNLSALDTCGKCLPGWMIFNSSCYLFNNNLGQGLTWKESRDDCIQRGGDLVVIDYPEEEIFLRNTINWFEMYNRNRFWIGISFVERAKTFVWLNNVTQAIRPVDRSIMFTYSHTCGYIWNSLSTRDCYERSNWICEMQTNQSVDVLLK
ncbi:C-type lectin domain family 12 member B-like isoform X2 [Sphaeramia orbicularis]|uniref:C-type lectin domain family 12 member B-like n=1 Tax=Sphaeramia orbicularis TaxID=375764 RepID=A0A673BIK3_9TELE|nr:C-type lectin domain family 12 member B-like isoform X2 [Sphaeramia orbicularis]